MSVEFGGVSWCRCALAPRETLAELLEWRRSLPGYASRFPMEYEDELRRLCVSGRIPAQGYRVDELGRPVGGLQLVPATEFFELRLAKGLVENHGELWGPNRLCWRGIRFSEQAKAVWLAALEAGDLGAPLAVGRPPLTSQASRPDAAIAPTTAKRPKKSIDDAEPLAAMLSMLADGRAVSVNQAANLVAEQFNEPLRVAAAARLRRKFRQKHGGTRPPSGKSWADVKREGSQ
jgi:hypothetical protein